MELDKEFIEQNGLNEDQVKAISSKLSDVIAAEKQTIEEALKGEASKSADGILDGAIKALESKYNFKYERPQGEKIADSAKNALSMVFKTKQEELDTLKGEYEEKVKRASGTDIEAIKKQYQDDKDELLKKYADYDELKEKAEKADEYGQKLSGLKLQVAFSDVKPVFPDTVNQYEAKAKWEDFKKGVLEKYDIELDENNEAICIDKENKYKTAKLAELVKNDSVISELTKGREQGGSGGKPVSKREIEGVPFSIEENANTEQISKAIRDYLLTDGGFNGILDKGYSDKFKEYLSKIKANKKVAA